MASDARSEGMMECQEEKPEDGLGTEGLPERLAVCPHCGSGGPDAFFEIYEVLPCTHLITPVVDDNGSLDYEYLDDETSVYWEGVQPAQDLDQSMPLFHCCQCLRDFNEFRVVTREEFIWAKMLGS